MKQSIFTIALVCATAFSRADEVKLTVTGPDGLAGTATLVNKVQQDGTKYVRLSMTLSYGGAQKSEILQESSYSPLGEPIRMLQTSKGQGKKTSIVVKFSEDGAQVVTDKGDGPKTNLVVPPSGTIANPTEFWFSKAKPTKGETAEFYTFRMSEQGWAKTKAKYEGDREIVVEGKRVTAHLVQMGEVKSYLDDKGDPYRIELGKLILERASV